MANQEKENETSIVFREINPEDVSSGKSGRFTELHQSLIKKLRESKTGALELDTTNYNRKPKSLSWGFQTYLKKNKITDIAVQLSEKDNKVRIKLIKE